MTIPLPPERRALLMGESQTSVQFTSVMAAVVFFSAAVLLQDQKPDRPAFELALALLFLAAFAFLCATLLYANTSAELARPVEGPEPSIAIVERGHEAGDIVSEYMGVYTLTVAVPVAVLGSTADLTLACVVAGFAILALAAYLVLGNTITGRAPDSNAEALAAVVAFTLPLPTVVLSAQDWEWGMPAGYFAGIALGLALGWTTIVALRNRCRPR
jgi:uncharacterized membrane protein